MSVRLVASDWENELREGLRVASGRWLVACPFIKRSVVHDLLAVAALDEIVVITRFNMRDFVKGVSDVEALRVLLDAGADIRGMSGLHAKVFVFGDQRAVVTSASLTKKGLSGNVEFGCVSEDPEFVRICAERVRQLHALGNPTTTAQLDAWAEEVDSFLREHGRDDPVDALADRGAEPPLQAPPEEAPAANSGEAGWVAESTQAWVKLAGTANDRAPLSKPIVQEVTDSGAFKFATYPKNQGHPWRVEKGATIFMSRITHSPNDHMIIGRAIAIAHNPDHDMASSDEAAVRPWLPDWPYLIRVHDPVFIEGALQDGLSLNKLMDELGPFSFARGKERALGGEANVNPRGSLMQHADVELSEEGFAWMTEHFEDALASKGQLDPDVVRALN